MSAPMIEDAKRANRLARTIASDILVYNREAVEQGIRNDDLFERLAEQISEGREHYEGRVGEALKRSGNHYNRALVDILLATQASVPSKAW